MQTIDVAGELYSFLHPPEQRNLRATCQVGSDTFDEAVSTGCLIQVAGKKGTDVASHNERDPTTHQLEATGWVPMGWEMLKHKDAGEGTQVVCLGACSAPNATTKQVRRMSQRPVQRQQSTCQNCKRQSSSSSAHNPTTSHQHHRHQRCRSALATTF